MKPGTLIDYKLSLYGFPMRWRSRIESFEPNDHFVDTQVKGPYAHWHHLHEFLVVAGGTEIRDIVHYRLPLAPLGNMALPLVRASLERIFDYRHRAVADVLTPEFG